MSNTPSAAFSDTKAHYDLLDGLRGVAALMVIWYHIFEGYAFASDTMITTFNHGYLAVDFFSFQVSLSAMPMMTVGVRVLQ
jgi:peptidoglycan/LPS O-acetylase OafA/YrhL